MTNIKLALNEEEKREPQTSVEEPQRPGSALQARLERIKREFYSENKPYPVIKTKTSGNKSRVKLVTTARETASAQGLNSITSAATPKEGTVTGPASKWPELAEAQERAQQRTFTDMNTIYKM